jgi:hypothetical protein
VEGIERRMIRAIRAHELTDVCHDRGLFGRKLRGVRLRQRRGTTFLRIAAGLEDPAAADALR